MKKNGLRPVMSKFRGTFAWGSHEFIRTPTQGARIFFAQKLQNSKKMAKKAANEAAKNTKENYTPYQVDKWNSLFVLAIYYHANPSKSEPYYSKFVSKERTMEEQLDAMTSLIIRKKLEARTMILYQNNKRGTGRHSDLPDNIEYVRIHHGKTVDFSRSQLDDDGKEQIRLRLTPLETN